MESADGAELFKYVIQDQDTLFHILRRFDTSVRDLIAYNGACDFFALEAGQTIYIKKSPCGTRAEYVLQENESLRIVAKKFKTSAAALLRANPHLFPQEIKPGIKMELPD